MPVTYSQLVNDVQAERRKQGAVHLGSSRLGPLISKKLQGLLGEKAVTISGADVSLTSPKTARRLRLSDYQTMSSGRKANPELSSELLFSVVFRGGGGVERKSVRTAVPRQSLLRIEGMGPLGHVVAVFFPSGDSYAGEVTIDLGGAYLESLLDVSLVGHSAVKWLWGISCKGVFRSYWPKGSSAAVTNQTLVGRLRMGPNLGAFLGHQELDVAGGTRDVTFERTISTEEEWDVGESDMDEDPVLPKETVTMTEVTLVSKARRVQVPARNPLLELRKVRFHVMSRQAATTDEIAPQIGLTGFAVLGKKGFPLWAPYLHDEAVLMFHSPDTRRLPVPNLSELATLVGGADWMAHLLWDSAKGAYLREFSLSYHLVHRTVTQVAFTLEAPGPVGFQLQPAHFAFEGLQTRVLIEAPQGPGRDVTVGHEGTLVVDGQWRFEAAVDVGEAAIVTARLGGEHGVPFQALKQSPFLRQHFNQMPLPEDACTEHYLRLDQQGFDIRTREALDEDSENEVRIQRERTYRIAYL